MKFFAQTAFEHIAVQIRDHAPDDGSVGRLLCMMPTIPIQACLYLGNLLEDHCAELDSVSSPLIKISRELCHEWEQAGDPTARDALAEIATKGWLDQTGNLTGYRNARSKDDRSFVLLLIGVDRVTDSASLADFHHCDYGTIWTAELRQSFRPWIRAKFAESSIGFEDESIAHFDQVLRAVVERGLGDILQVSSLLEELDLSAAQDGRDAETTLLVSLGRFNLPSFSGFQFSGRRSFGPYLEDAVAFFSYDALLEDRARQSVLKTIGTFVEHNELGELFDRSERGPFATDQAFVDALRHYVAEANPGARHGLLQCDFVTIHDRILGFRAPRGDPPPKKETVRKLSGGPVEVVLTGIWRSLAEFKKTASEAGVLAHEAIREIRVESRLFKHDCDGESAAERDQRARTYIARLLGGVDGFIEEWLRLPRWGDSETEVGIHSTLVHDGLDCQPCRTAEPFLQFSVEIIGDGVGSPVVQQFAWRLPGIEPYRVADQLLQWAAHGIAEEDGYCLPAFHVPYYEELMLAKDDEETRRVLLQCVQDESKCVFNLLGAKGLDSGDPLLKDVERLAFEYDRFVQTAAGDGLHTALLTQWDTLRKAYERACDLYLRSGDCSKSPLATLLFRSFLIIQRRQPAERDRWVWGGDEPSAAVTVLHPALLEMLQAHILYLMGAFATVARRELRAPGTRSFRDVVWQNYVDLAQIQMPISGLLKGHPRDLRLDTSIRGENLIHRVGQLDDAEASLTTRLLLRYDSVDEEEVSDAELFRDTRESTLIYRVLRDYRRLHPHATDGLSIAVYQNQDIQPVIAAVHQFLLDTCQERSESPLKYAMSVTIFTESSDDTSVSRWISQWKERWEAAETEGSLAHYRRTHLAVAHRIVSPDNYYDQFSRLIEDGLQVDIAFLNEFIGAGSEGNAFEEVDAYDVTGRALKFPVLEKPFCSLRDPGRELQRARVLSNRQFRIGTRHAEIMARLKSSSTPQNSHHVVVGFGDYTPWQGVVDALHRHAEWVVCIDPNIDERLVAEKGEKTQETREIIGFGSGVGSHGEANYTISTEQFRLSDVLHRLTAAVGEIYSGWQASVYEGIAAGVLRESRRLSGLSLVRATGIGQYIRDFMAYSITRKLLHADSPVLCDQLVSLDAYRHWFDAADSGTRPDLLWLVARVGEDGRIQLDLRVVECKLAKMADQHLEKARQQIENGLRHLATVFRPRIDSEASEDDRPDQRYWWLQLHRLIASKAEIAGRDQGSVLAALERLVEGDFSVEWHAAAVTYWTDQTTREISLVDEWGMTIEGQEIDIGVVSAGSEFVRCICAESLESSMPWSNSFIRFEGHVEKAKPGEADEESGGDGGGGHLGRMPGDDGPGPAIGPKSAAQATGEQEGGVRKGPQGAVTKRIPQRILLGAATQGGRQVYWEFGHKELSNRHMLIFGTSGMGKTYAIQCLLCELSKCEQNSLIIDYTNGFLPNQLEPETKDMLKPEQHVIRQSPLPINPFRLQSTDIGGLVLPESESTAAKRIAAIFQNVYDLGEQQFSVLFDAIASGVKEHGEHMSLGILVDILADFAADETKNKSATQTVQSKIRPFVMDNPFQPGADALDWTAIFGDESQRCHIFQLAGLDLHTWRLTTEFILWDLYAFLQSSGSKDDPKVVVLDEVQNLDQGEGGPLSKYLREGRKFGVSLIMATQIMSSLNRDERDRMFNAGHKLFFRPADTEIKSYAEIAAVATSEKVDVWMRRLAGLQKGECYSLGPSLNESAGTLESKVFKIRVSPLSGRGEHA